MESLLWGKDETTIHGGSTGVVLTLDKYSYQNLARMKPIIKPVDDVMEQFVIYLMLH